MADFITERMVAPSQRHWPTERAEVIKAAVRACGGEWPSELPSGVMFYMGERITRADFRAAIGQPTGGE
jgi:hypothetical protein